jgi:glucose/mannose transport system substrate-binding protein
MSEKPEKKVVSRKIAIALGIIIIIALVGLAGAMVNYTAMINGKDNTISTKDSQIQTLINQKNQIQTFLDGNRTMLNETQAWLQGNNTYYNSQINSLSSQITSLQNQKSQLQTWLGGNTTNYQAQVSSLNAQISQLQTWLNGNVTSLNSQITNLQNQISSLSLQISSLNSRIVELENQLSARGDLLTIYEWWTSGAEADALYSLVSVYQNLYPNVTVILCPVAGGAGYVFRSVIKPLVLAGEAPDALQVHAGYEMQSYVDGGYLEPINDLWSSQNWINVFPSVINAMVQGADGNYYAVPLDIHRANVVWYNKAILTAHNINASTLTTWNLFFNACKKLSDEGVTSPISLGDSGKWAASHVLEQMIAGEGISFYQDYVNGKVTNASDPKLLDALNTFKTYLGYVNTDHASLTWDQATARLITNASAFNVMGDWANGEFLKAGKVYGTDYGTFVVPGTQGYYGLVIDCFQHLKGVKHPDNSLDWLKVVGSKEGQDIFNPLKGSISPRNDSDITKYGPYQRLSAIPDFKAAIHMYPSVVHGSGAPESFTTKLDDIMSAFVTNKDIGAAATALTNAIKDASADYTKTWSL